MIDIKINNSIIIAQLQRPVSSSPISFIDQLMQELPVKLKIVSYYVFLVYFLQVLQLAILKCNRLIERPEIARPPLFLFSFHVFLVFTELAFRDRVDESIIRLTCGKGHCLFP